MELEKTRQKLNASIINEDNLTTISETIEHSDQGSMNFSLVNSVNAMKRGSLLQPKISPKLAEVDNDGSKSNKNKESEN